MEDIVIYSEDYRAKFPDDVEYRYLVPMEKIGPINKAFAALFRDICPHAGIKIEESDQDNIEQVGVLHDPKRFTGTISGLRRLLDKETVTGDLLPAN